MRAAFRSLLLAAATPWLIAAGDLGEAIELARHATADIDGTPLAELASDEDDSALAMLNSRDVVPGRALDTYDCVRDSPIDAEWVLRNKGDARWVDRACRERQFARDSLPGYRTLGTRRLEVSEAESILEAAARTAKIPPALLISLARFTSGFRPAAESESGALGLVQLPPEAQHGFTREQLVDPQVNARIAASYLRGLLDRYGSVERAVIAYVDGPRAAEEGLPLDKRTLWLVRELRNDVHLAEAAFPKQQAIEDVVFIWTWLE